MVGMKSAIAAKSKATAKLENVALFRNSAPSDASMARTLLGRDSLHYIKDNKDAAMSKASAPQPGRLEWSLESMEAAGGVGEGRKKEEEDGTRHP